MSWYKNCKGYMGNVQKYEAGEISKKPKGNLSYKMYSLLNSLTFGLLDTSVSIINSFVSMLDFMEEQYSKDTVGGKIVGGLGTALKIAAIVGIAILGSTSPIILAIAGAMGIKFIATKFKKLVNWLKGKDDNKEKDDKDKDVVERADEQTELENSQDISQEMGEEEFAYDLQEREDELNTLEERYNNLSSHGEVGADGGYMSSPEANQIQEQIVAKKHELYQLRQTELGKKENAVLMKGNMRSTQAEMLEHLAKGESIIHTTKEGREVKIKMNKDGNLECSTKSPSEGKRAVAVKSKLSQDEILNLLVDESIPGIPLTYKPARSNAVLPPKEAIDVLESNFDKVTTDVSERMDTLADRWIEAHPDNRISDTGAQGMAFKCTELVFKEREERQRNAAVSREEKDKEAEARRAVAEREM